MRFQAVVLGGALMGVAGAFLSMAQFNAFTFGVISGRGWVAIALVVFGRWDPWRCAAAALLFAAIDALQLRLRRAGLGHIPYEVFLVLPFRADHRRHGVGVAQRRRPAALLKRSGRKSGSEQARHCTIPAQNSRNSPDRAHDSVTGGQTVA